MYVSIVGPMLSIVKTFKICILLLFGASAMSAKHGSGINFEEATQRLEHNKILVSVPITDRFRYEGNLYPEMKPANKLQANGIENDKIEFDDELWTNLAENRETTTTDTTKNDSISFDQKELKGHLSNMEKGHNVKVTEQPLVKPQKTENENKLSKKFIYGRKIELLNRIQINMNEDCEHDLEEGLPLWTKMQTRQPASSQGPILGFRKGSKRFARTVSSCLSKSASFLAKRKRALEGNKVQSDLESQSSFSQDEPSIAPKTVGSQPPSPKPESPKYKMRKPAPWVPPVDPFEPFCVAEEIKSIVMIPGSGEFVYDTKIQQKTPKRRYGTPEPPEKINENNGKGKSDAMLSLDQLKEDLPKVKWVSVVVNWFGNSIQIENCEIYPAVEFRDGFVVKPDDWGVGWLTREKARLISRDRAGNPRYGGTVSDGALKRYIEELHRRRYKVMLYPMLVFDTKDKEWRGRLTGAASEISNFFKDKYNPFIKHYAFIARQTKVEGFIIGSEFVGLTSVRDDQGYYPAVLELVKLAKVVKEIVEKPITVTYAADWTEYNIGAGGWYPLDELWASQYIDVVGINAYFPLTDYKEPSGGYTVKDAIRGWTTGEGYSYYYDYKTGSPEFVAYPEGEDSIWAWKNIDSWWRNPHFNVDGSFTAWEPGMKKIWFTEFGFPSVDGCTNEPYIFVDGTSKDTRYPRYSNRQVSLNSQEVAIEGTLKKWRNSEMVERMFLYAWDARPFPYFPVKREVWGDGLNWETGHWIQGKIGKVLGVKRDDVRTSRKSLSLPKRSQPVSGAKFQVR